LLFGGTADESLRTPKQRSKVARSEAWRRMDEVTTVIVIVLALLAVGIVVDQLFRLRKWLNQAPPKPKDLEPPDEQS